VIAGAVFAPEQVKAGTVNFSIRYQDTMVIDTVEWDLDNVTPHFTNVQNTADTESGVQVEISSTNGNKVSFIDAKSVLAVLTAIDRNNDAFSISDLQYWGGGLDSFIVNCFDILGVTNACSDWSYRLNGVTAPAVEDQILSDGDTVFFFFGPANRITLGNNVINSGHTFFATAESYSYVHNTWVAYEEGSVGVSLYNEDGGVPIDGNFNTIILESKPATDTGRVEFGFTASGEYGIGIVESGYWPIVNFTIVDLIPSIISPGSPYVAPVEQSAELNRENAEIFLLNHQDEVGSFGESVVFTDWAAIAIAALEGEENTALIEYLLSDPSSGNEVTDYERRSMALLAMGLNPYSATETNYIQKIVDAFDEEQIGDVNHINDDIFGLLVLVKSGYTTEDLVVSQTIEYILSQQEDLGSWDSVDMTAAAVQALALVSSYEGVSEALTEAEAYLQNIQSGSDGGFGNIYSTSWAVQAIAALGQDSATWVRAGNTPETYFAAMQAVDGGFEIDSDDGLRLWATSYAIPAILGKSWGDILVQVEAVEEIDGYALVNGQKVYAQVFIPEDAAVTLSQGEWDGTTVTTDSAESLEEAIEVMEGESIAELGVQGVVDVFVGEDVALVFDREIVISIPVFSSPGTLLYVYSLSAFYAEYQYEGQCAVGENSLCVIGAKHLSRFVAVANMLEIPQIVEVVEEEAGSSKEEIAVVYAQVSLVLDQVVKELEVISQKVATLAAAERTFAENTDLSPVAIGDAEQSQDDKKDASATATSDKEEDDTNVLSAIDLSQPGITDPELLVAGVGLESIADQLPQDSSNGLVLGIFLGGFTIVWLFGLYLFIRFMQQRKARSIVPTIPSDIVSPEGQN